MDADAKDINVKEYDCLVIPYGYAPDLMCRYPGMVLLIRDAFDQGKVVAETGGSASLFERDYQGSGILRGGHFYLEAVRGGINAL